MQLCDSVSSRFKVVPAEIHRVSVQFVLTWETMALSCLSSHPCTPLFSLTRFILYQELFDAADIGYTDYIRTTDSQHVKLVEAFWVSTYSSLHHHLTQDTAMH